MRIPLWRGCFVGLTVALTACKATPGSQQANKKEASRQTGVPEVSDGLRTFVYADTARYRLESGDPYPTASTDWIWFAERGDSLDMSASLDGQVSTSWSEQSHRLRTDPGDYGHTRIHEDGVIAVWILYQSSFLPDTFAYTFVVRRMGESATPLIPTGQFAILAVPEKTPADSFRIVPLSIAHMVANRRPWQIHTRPYRVALVSDSLYEICGVPCTRPDTIKLTAGATIVHSF